MSHRHSDARPFARPGRRLHVLWAGRELIPTHGFRFEHILQDIQTLERARHPRRTRHLRHQHSRLCLCQRPIRPAAQRRQHGRRLRPDARGETEALPARRSRRKTHRRARHHDQRLPGAATLAGQAGARDSIFVVVPFDQIFAAVRAGAADVGLIIHEGQLTYRNEGLVVCDDLGVWWGRETTVCRCRSVATSSTNASRPPTARSFRTSSPPASIQPRPPRRGCPARAAICPRHGLGPGRQIRRDVCEPLDARLRRTGPGSHPDFLGRAFDAGLIPHRQELEFVT